MTSKAMRVLILDDDEDDAFLIEDAFGEVRERSYDCHLFHMPHQAMDALRTAPFDVILCDYRLGALSGVEVIRAIRAEGIHTPVILLTGMESAAVDEEALAAGAADFLAKGDATSLVLDRAVRYAVANASKERLIKSVLDNASAGVAVVTADDEIVLCNPQFSSFADALAPALTDGETETTAALARYVVGQAGADITLADRTLEHTVTPLDDGNQLILLHDVTDRANALREREEAEARVTHMAFHDSLTELPNRAAFSARLDEDVAAALRRNGMLGVLNIDLNGFKEINDLYGHAAGDELLRITAKRLMSCLRTTDFVARLGGDEFVVVVPEADRTVIMAVANRIHEAMASSVAVDGRALHCRGSIGVAIFPDHGGDAEQLVCNADLAMYRSKQIKVGVCLFDEEMDTAVRARRMMAEDLRAAIKEDAISVVYQPQAKVGTGELCGFEALARWTHNGEAIRPDVFIPVAEQSGLIVPLGTSVLRNACRDAMLWDDEHKVAVNVSPVQITRGDLVKTVHEVLFETGLPPRRLELEVTETALIEDIDRTLHVLRRLKALGISIAMDDFGTGYSSLGTLQAFPFDKIKLDRSFVAMADAQGKSDAIIEAVVRLGDSLGMPILAEGVENREQVSFLDSIGCQEMQGYLIGRPMPLSDILPSKGKLRMAS